MADVFKIKIKGKKSRCWYGKIQDPVTKKWSKVNLEVTDKQTARSKLRERQKREERIAAGEIVPANETSLADHLAAFVEHLRQKGRGEVYRLQTEGEIIKVALFCSRQPVPVKIDRKNMDDYRKKL